MNIQCCFDIDNLPQPVNNIEEAMASPYNIQIEGLLSENVRAISEDSHVIFFCESDSRVVTREIIIYEDFGGIDREPYEIGRCSFTIETIPHLNPADFTVPPDIEIPCNVNPFPEITGSVTDIQLECNTSIYQNDGIEIFFADDVISEGEITTVQRTWLSINFCGLQTEKIQTITITCSENTFLGAFGCFDIDNLPQPVNNIEEAMAPPYNIQIEGELTENIRATSEDSDVIFFCEGDTRVVTREIIIYSTNGQIDYVPDVIGRCSFMIETIPDVTPLEFIAPADYEIACNNPEMYPGDVTFPGNDCFAFDQSQAFFRDEEKVEGTNLIIVRTWRTTDACGNISEPQEQMITYNCESANTDITIICPNNTFLGIFDCMNIEDVPDLPGNLEEAMASPYNIQIEGDLTPTVRVDSNDDGIIFYCESDSRSVNRSVIIYDDINLNFIFDVGEQIGACNYTIETIPDLTPMGLTIPPDIELACGIEPETDNTGNANYDNSDCPVRFVSDPTFYTDEVIVNGGVTTIQRSWSASDPCGNISEPQIQIITINCAPVCVPPNTGTFDCGN